MKGYEIEVESLSPDRAVERLRREGIVVLSAKRTQKNTALIVIDGKDRKKAFAILQKSCYNRKKVRAVGLVRIREALSRGVGLLAGCLAAFGFVLFAQSRVLRVEVEGSGAYLRSEVESILQESGVKPFSPLPKESSALVASVLRLPRVCFCAMGSEGGVLTVRVEVENGLSSSSESLVAPAAGTVEELLVLRGTPLVSVGDEVGLGDLLVGGYALYGEDVRPVEVVARAKIVFPVKAEYETDEESARAQALLDFGSLSDMTLKKTERGWLVEGTGAAFASMNFE